MTEAQKSLRGTLDRQKAVYGELLALAEQQSDALIARRTSDLENIEARQSALLSQASRLEANVESKLRELSESFGPDCTPTVLGIAEHLDAPERATLKLLCAEIQGTLSRLYRVIRVNAELFESAMDCVRFTVQLLAGACQPSSMCYPAMNAQRNGTSLVVDQMA